MEDSIGRGPVPDNVQYIVSTWIERVTYVRTHCTLLTVCIHNVHDTHVCTYVCTYKKGTHTPLHILQCVITNYVCTVLPIVNFMTSGGQTESCQMTVRVLINDRTGVNC